MPKPPDIDLMPREWKSERPKPREPVLGPGFLAFVGFLICLVLLIAAKAYLLTLF